MTDADGQLQYFKMGLKLNCHSPPHGVMEGVANKSARRVDF